MFFGKAEYACVYRPADLVTYEYDSETAKNSEGQEETKERAIWCQQADIRYWKVDWGTHERDVAFLRCGIHLSLFPRNAH